MDWVRLLTTAQGRIGRKSFWVFVAVYFGASFAIDFTYGFFSDSAGPSRTGLIASIVRLILVYPSVCVSTKRLHDTGRTGWWQTLPIGLAIGMLTVGVPLRKGVEQGGSTASALLLIALSAAVLGTIALLFVWLGLLKGDAGPNRFGEPNSGDRKVEPVAEVFS